MKQRIKNILLAFTIALVGGMIAVPAIASADFKGDACKGVNTLNGTSGTTCDAAAGTKVGNLVKAIIRILSIVVGLAAVIMVIVGGLKYVTANGDSGALASARNTIIYALLGLVVVAVAQVLVRYVIFRT